MGLLDRFTRPRRPDALTLEATARALTVPGVVRSEAVDADTVHVWWASYSEPATLDLTETRSAWTRADGFDRIEIMDEVIAGLVPPATPDPAPMAPTPAPPTAVPTDTLRWPSARQLLTVVVDRPGQRAGAVRWTAVEGIEALAAIDGDPRATVTAEHLLAWGVEAAEVRAAALGRLAEAGPQLDPIGPDQPAWVPTSAVAPPPAWLAVPEALLAAAGLEQAVALAPLRSELVVVDPDDVETLASVLSSTTAIVAGADELLLGSPVLIGPTSVVPWVPPAEHPCADLVARLRAHDR